MCAIDVICFHSICVNCLVSVMSKPCLVVELGINFLNSLLFWWRNLAIYIPGLKLFKFYLELFNKCILSFDSFFLFSEFDFECIKLFDFLFHRLQFSSNFLKQPILLVNQWFPRLRFIDCWQSNYAWNNHAQNGKYNVSCHCY